VPPTYRTSCDSSHNPALLRHGVVPLKYLINIPTCFTRFSLVVCVALSPGCATQTSETEVDSGVATDTVPSKDVGTDALKIDIFVAGPDAPPLDDVPPLDEPMFVIDRPIVMEDLSVTMDTSVPPADRMSVPDSPIASDVVVRDVPVTDPCASSPDCAMCTARLSCGWCGATMGCVTGSSSGPTGSTCASGWAFLSSACMGSTDPCAAATTCGACAAVGSCGWCGATNRCMRGTSTGPTGATCSTGWAGTVTACMSTSDPCAAATTCGVCSAMGSCGWCRATQRCMSGTATGPSMGTCTAGTWSWTRNQCTALPTDGCGSSSGCVGCRARSNCGWCSDSDSCHSGTSSGPTDRSCTNGDWRWSTVLFCL
jgi:hypothetical protein